MADSREVFTSHTHARLDRLPWSRFHWLVVAALGVTWILDGLEVTLVGSLSPAIRAQGGLDLTAEQIGMAGSAYILGAVLGSLIFGRLTDRYGRKKLFTITVAVYLVATILTGFSWDFWSFLAFRFFTGAGIGGEYGAVNSAIDELIPARRRGQVALIINGSFWVGAALGALSSVIVLDPEVIDQTLGWRLAFVVGGLLALIIIWIRRFIPESPRWLVTHGRPEAAEAIVTEIEARVERETGRTLPPPEGPPLRLIRRTRTPWGDIFRSLFVRYPSRTVLGLTLMGTQAFCYNAIFFTYAMILTDFYGVAASSIGWFMLPFALGNFTGPLLLGRLFDTVGRKTMISLTYGVAGALMCLTGWMFSEGMLTAETQTAAWMVIFFFASAGASAAYLTVGELFPLEIRAMTISLFYAVGTLLGGMTGPWLFGLLIDSRDPGQILIGYLIGGVAMLVAAAVELWLGVAAEQKSLEAVATPLTQVLDDAP